jgi:hypothetical protein
MKPIIRTSAIGRAHIRKLRIDELEVGRIIRLDDADAGSAE